MDESSRLKLGMIMIEWEVKTGCYESPKKEIVSHAFEHLIYNIKTHNGVKI